MFADVFEIVFTVIGEKEHQLPAAQLLQYPPGGAAGFGSHRLTCLFGRVKEKLMLKLIFCVPVEMNVNVASGFTQQARHLFGVVQELRPMLIQNCRLDRLLD